MFATDTYDNITDFEWVLSVLIDLAYISNVDAGEDIKEMILDIVARVRDVRGYAVAMLSRVLRDEAFIEGARDAGSCGELVYAAAWVSGEYSRGRELSETQATIRHLLQPSVAHLPPATIAVCIHSAAKAFGHWAAEASERWSKFMHEDAQELVASILQALKPYRSSGEIEVQERAANISQLFQFIEADLAAHKPPSAAAHQAEAIDGMDEGFASSSGSNDPPFPKSLFLLQPLFTSYEMTSVAYKAQESVRIPDGVDLDTEIVAGGGFAAGDEEDEESDGERDDGDELGDGGGSGMEALRKAIRGQEGEKSSSGKKKKSKPRVKANGEVETKEERAKVSGL
jgi:AP-3 complex subunit delta-1